MTERATQTTRRQLLTGRARVAALIGFVTAASVAVWAHNFAAFGTTGTVAQVTLPWPVLALVFYLSESYVVHLQFRKQAHTLSASEIGLTLGLFFVSPAGLLAAQLVGAGVAIIVNRRQKPIKVWFNLAELSLSCGLGLLVFRSIVAVGEHRRLDLVRGAPCRGRRARGGRVARHGGDRGRRGSVLRLAARPGARRLDDRRPVRLLLGAVGRRAAGARPRGAPVARAAGDRLRRLVPRLHEPA